MLTRCTLSIVVAVVGAVCGLSSCHKTASSEQNAVVDKYRKVKDPKNIEVCFVNRSEFPGDFDTIKSLIEQEFHKKTDLRFTGLTDCTQADLPSRKIRIEITNGSIACGGGEGFSGCSFVGPTSSSIPNTRKASIIVQSSKVQGKWFVHTILHELGHAIGLHHEHARTDSPHADACRQQSGFIELVPNTRGISYIGEYDADSIMNYCSNSYVLSKGDVEGIAALYRAEPVPGPTAAATGSVPTRNK